MNLCLSTHFLVAGLFLSSSALTLEECQPLITPLPMTPSMMLGRSHFLFGYTDNEVYNDLLKNTESYWMNVNTSPSSPKTMVMSTGSKMNGTCLTLNVNGTIDGNTASISVANITSVFHVLPTCDGCLLMSINSAVSNLDKMLRMMKINSDVTAEKFNVHALYLFARETTVKDSDLEHFKKQASCLGFKREPDFIYDPKNDFCAEGEGLKMIDDEHHSLDMSN